MKKTLEFIKKCGVFYIATVEDDQPRVRPFGAVMEWDGKIYLCTGKAKPVYQQITKNPKIEICCTSPDGGSWLRLSAEAVPDERREAKSAFLDASPSLRSMYSEDDGNFAVLYLKNATSTIASFSARAETEQF